MRHPNTEAIGKALISGFLDDKDIQEDLGLKSVKQADRILSPLPDNYISNEGKWSNHFRKRDIIKVWHVRQNTVNGPKIYGLNKRPKKVVSTVDYIHFLLNDYKNSPTKKYAKNKYTKLGKDISSD